MSKGDDLDLNVLSSSRTSPEKGEHGWFEAGTYSFEWLLKHRVVTDWIDAYSNPRTRKQKLYQFEKALGAARMKEPSELLKLTDGDAKSLVKRICQWYVQNGKGAWARQMYSTMKGFYEAHDRDLRFRRVEKVRVPAAKKIEFQHIPKTGEVYLMAAAGGSLRNRAVILCLFESGVRVGCLCRWTYGLVSGQLYPQPKVPIRLKITSAMDTKLAGYRLNYYYTFLSTEAAEALRDYIEERKRDGWTPKPNDPVFAPDTNLSKWDHLTTGGVWEIVKNAAEKAGLQTEGVWTHVLRKSFRRVLNATPELGDDFREALMGHKLPGSRDSYYDHHDVGEAAKNYALCDWTRDGAGQFQEEFDRVRKAADAKALEVTALKHDLDQLRTDQNSEIVALREATANLAFNYKMLEKDMAKGRRVISLHINPPEGLEDEISTIIGENLDDETRQEKLKKFLARPDVVRQMIAELRAEKKRRTPR